jgi:hypothetical protein
VRENSTTNEEHCGGTHNAQTLHEDWGRGENPFTKTTQSAVLLAER